MHFVQTRATATYWLTLASTLLAAASLVAGCGKKPGPGAGGPPPTPQVGYVVVQAQRVALTTELAGRTSAHLVADVRPQVNGLIKSRAFTEGTNVKAGQLLYQIDPATYQAAYNSAQAALQKAQASLVSVRAKAQRYKELLDIQAVSQQDYDDALSSQQQGEADIANNKATLETDRINLGYTRVTAPISGRIGRSSVTAGALVTAAQTTALATVQQLDPIFVDVTQSTTDLLRLKRALAQGALVKSGKDAARVHLVLEDGSTYGHDGTLEFTDVTVDQTTGAVTLRAVFPNPKVDLLPGMYVRAVLEEGVDEQALLVPQPAVSRDNAGKPNVMVIGADDKLQLRPITTTRAIGDQWLVGEGLKAGERIVVDGGQKARPGTAVKPVAVAASGASSAPRGAASSATASGPSAPGAAQSATPN